MKDREHAIAGSEWIVFSVGTREVLAVLRAYALTGKTRNAPDGIWWLNAANCPDSKDNLSKRFYDFVIKVLEPSTGEVK